MKGRLLLVWRLAVKDLRHRPTQALLLLFAIAASAAALTLGLSLHGTTNDPYARTRSSTNGPDVVATTFTGGSNLDAPAQTASPNGQDTASGGALPGPLLPFVHASGVAAYSGPFPVAWTTLHVGQTTGSAEVEGRNTTPSAVDQPMLITGTWVHPGSVVIEAAFASALGIHVGDQLTLGGHPFAVTGIAVTAAVPAYPGSCAPPIGCFLVGDIGSHNPGLVWAAEPDADQIAGIDGPEAYSLNLKLNDPAQAITFANRNNNDGAAARAATLYPWQVIRDGDAQVIAKAQQVLITGSTLLALLAVASVAILVSGRMAEQIRRLGLMKAVGGTPAFVAGVLLIEHMLIGVCAAGVGLVTGWLLAPLIDGPGAGLLGAPSAPTLTGTTIGVVVALSLAVALVATLVPAVRAARQSTLTSLNNSARPPRRNVALTALSAHLPPTLLLGVRLVARRPRRLLFTVFSVAVTSSGLVAVMIVRTRSAMWSLGPQVARATSIITIMLIVLAAVNAAFIAWTTALETRAPTTLARALGATPGQITAGPALAFLPPTLLGAILGIAGGIGIFEAARNGPGHTALPSTISLAAMVALTGIVIAVLTCIPTRISARRPVADMIRAVND
ncbi:MAG: ABC transporter permease [Ilumatobacteraceae bacterium]